jgi:hypothetical protein
MLYNRKTRKKEKMLKTNYKIVTNNLDKLFEAMRTGKYHCVLDPKGNAHMGLINGIMREDGSGKNWIVTINSQLRSEQVFIHAS